MLRTTNGQFSIDDGKTWITENKGYAYAKILVRDEKTQTIVTLSSVALTCDVTAVFTIEVA